MEVRFAIPAFLQLCSIAIVAGQSAAQVLPASIAGVNTLPPAQSLSTISVISAQKVKSETQCKNCPFTNCLNSGFMATGTVLDFGCWTHGEAIGGDDTWLKFQYGLSTEDYCYISRSDLTSTTEGDQSTIPYCGPKSQMHFYLPLLQTKSVYYTECSICPYRDCDGINFYQPGSNVSVNCIFDYGWNQLSPLRPNGTRQYYRTQDNCYVSTSTVEELPGKPYVTVQIGPTQTVVTQNPLPSCGPVPILAAPPQPS